MHDTPVLGLFKEYCSVTNDEKPVKKTALSVTGVGNALSDEEVEKLTSVMCSDTFKVKFVCVTNLDKEDDNSSCDAIFSNVPEVEVSCDLDLYSTYTRLLTASGKLIINSVSGGHENLIKRLKQCGFMNVIVGSVPEIVIGFVPSYKVGHSDKVTLNLESKKDIISAWKLEDDNSEIISEDDLLEADDLKKPDSLSLKVCATTKKAKACKNCSCGLAEELEANRIKETSKPPDTSNAKSSCGSCYLGDAFRCASCPYLGMPAFKPGEKVQLAGNLLQDDF